MCAFHSCARYRRPEALFCVQQGDPLVESSKVTPWLRIKQVPARFASQAHTQSRCVKHAQAYHPNIPTARTVTQPSG